MDKFIESYLDIKIDEISWDSKQAHTFPEIQRFYYMVSYLQTSEAVWMFLIIIPGESVLKTVQRNDCPTESQKTSSVKLPK